MYTIATALIQGVHQNRNKHKHNMNINITCIVGSQYERRSAWSYIHGFRPWYMWCMLLL